MAAVRGVEEASQAALLTVFVYEDSQSRSDGAFCLQRLIRPTKGSTSQPIPNGVDERHCWPSLAEAFALPCCRHQASRQYGAVLVAWRLMLA